MKTIDLEAARQQENLLFECVAGSRAYGTDTPESDTDLRGVFILPKELFFGSTYTEQVSDATNDETYYEIGRFIQLLGKNNPNLMEMLFVDEEMVRVCQPLFRDITAEMVLSKLCEHTFGGYAMTQVRKARGLNKKIVNPMEGPRKSILEFCYVVRGQGSKPLNKWLAEQSISQEQCGLVSIPHMREVYGIYVSDQHPYRGIIRDPESTEIRLSSIPKSETAIGWMSFNKDGYKRYCKDYREYKEWVENRNDARYRGNIEHGKNYDSKNMMHTFRLLAMAKEIAEEGKVRVRRPEVDFLMKIRHGEFDYDELVERAENEIGNIQSAFKKSDLPDEPNLEALEEVLIGIRKSVYG